MKTKKEIERKIEQLRDERDRVTSNFIRERDILQAKYEIKQECIMDHIDSLREIISKK